MKLFFAALIAILFMAPAANSGTLASATKVARGFSHAMCVADTSTGNCDANGTPDVYAVVDMYATVTFTYTESGTGSCVIYGSGPENDVPGTDDLDSFETVQLNTTALTLAAPQLTLSDFDFKYVWVDCATVGTSVTVYMQGSYGVQKW